MVTAVVDRCGSSSNGWCVDGFTEVVGFGRGGGGGGGGGSVKGDKRDGNG